MKILIIVILAGLVIWLVASWLSIRSIEEPKYDVVSKNKTYEVRMYEPYIVAETVVSGSYDKALNNGFRNIADYIFGNNTASEKIAMTTPVSENVDKDKSEKIDMTVPVIDQGDDIRRVVSFVMPSKYTLETIPKPNTDLVNLREVEERKVAVLEYGWYTNKKKIKEKTEILLKQLEEDGVETVGEVSSARYNPPLSIPVLLRNEVLIEIK